MKAILEYFQSVNQVSHFSIAYTAPKLLEVSTAGKVNIKVSDDPLYNLVRYNKKSQNQFVSHVLFSDLQTVFESAFYCHHSSVGSCCFQFEDIFGHQKK